MSEIKVIKRDGVPEPLNIDKLHKVTMQACEGITGVSASEVELRSQLSFYDGIRTKDIQETLIKSAADLISEDKPNYQHVAGRLINYQLRKEVYGSFEPPHIYDHVVEMVKKGVYDKSIFKHYSADDFTRINDMINHDRDDDLVYAAMEQMRGKYLVKNRVTGEIYETPQMAFMLIPMYLYADKPKKKRLKMIKEAYDAISTFDISLPTPIMAGVRTPQKQFSSCVLIDCDDSLDSINATSSAIVKYVSQRAGIGVNYGRLRSINSPIRGGQAYHTGVIPFIKYGESATKSCSQGSIRGGAATFYFPCWHYEIEEIMVLKNNKGTEDNRARKVDYCIQFNRLMYERLIEGGNITLFSPSQVPGLYEAFFTDYDKFKELYEQYERSRSILKRSVPAIDLFTQFLTERKETGRIYLMNVDNVNNQSPFYDTIYMSNLCTEINLPTKPLKNIFDEEGEIALCTLAAINWGKIREPKDFEKPCRIAVNLLDALLDYQDYPVKAAEMSTKRFRPLGIGIINLAYWLAKNDLKYSDPEALELVDEYAEAWSYYLIKASNDIQKELSETQDRPMKPEANMTKYDFGEFPWERRKKAVDELVPLKLRMPWETLRQDLKDYLMRNGTVMAQMPAETSAQVSNSTNGVEQARGLITVKQSKDGVLKQVVPEIRRLKNKYELLWDSKNPKGYLRIMAVLQKWMDQAISVNTSYNPCYYEDNKIPMSELMTDMLEFYKYGGRQLYYFNTFDGAGELEDLPELEVEEIDDEDCDSCKI